MKERRVTFTPAWDKRHENPSKNYGIHCVELRFELVNTKEHKAVQFVLYTNWFTPEVQAERDQKDLPMSLRRPLPVDLGYHSPYPMYEGQQKIEDDCCVIGGPCYYDGSGLRAEHVFERLLREGSDGVWAALEEEYEARFGDGD